MRLWSLLEFVPGFAAQEDAFVRYLKIRRKV